VSTGLVTSDDLNPSLGGLFAVGTLDVTRGTSAVRARYVYGTCAVHPRYTTRTTRTYSWEVGLTLGCGPGTGHWALALIPDE
jgi:hypothetical protein